MYDISGVESFKGFPSAPPSAAGSRPDVAELDVQAEGPNDSIYFATNQTSTG
jgi:hypothetical protein